MTPFLQEMPLTRAESKWISRLRQKKYRDETGCFMAEGRKCIEELAAGFDGRLLVVRDQAPVLEGFVSVRQVTDKQMAELSLLTTPTDYLAVFLSAPVRRAENTDSLILALDGVQDPGNMGTILRTCDWMGVSQVLCSRQTADCFAPKVVQATMGALAHLTVTYTDLPETLCQLRSEQGYAVLGTTLEGHDIYQSAALADAEKVVLVMGNEGNGLTPAVRQCLDEQLLLPAYGVSHVESLNVAVATAWVLAEYRRIHSSAITL